MLLRTAVLERSCICEMVQLSLGARAAKHSEQSSNLCALVNGGQHLCLLFFSYECWVVFQRFRKESPFFFGFDAVKIESSHSLANIKYLLVQISVCEGVRPYHFFFFWSSGIYFVCSFLESRFVPGTPSTKWKLIQNDARRKAT